MSSNPVKGEQKEVHWDAENYGNYYTIPWPKEIQEAPQKVQSNYEAFASQHRNDKHPDTEHFIKEAWNEEFKGLKVPEGFDPVKAIKYINSFQELKPPKKKDKPIKVLPKPPKDTSRGKELLDLINKKISDRRERGSVRTNSKKRKHIDVSFKTKKKQRAPRRKSAKHALKAELKKRHTSCKKQIKELQKELKQHAKDIKSLK